MLFTSSAIDFPNIQSISEKFHIYTTKKNNYAGYSNTTIKSENLQFNLSLIIAHIIQNLTFVDRSRHVFEQVIHEYNQLNKTNVIFADFERTGWIRSIADEVLISAMARSYLWRITKAKREGTPIDIVDERMHIVLNLQLYYERCFENARLTINEELLKNILATYANKMITIDFLIGNEILDFDPETKLFVWKDNEYSRHLRNEITATLWLIVSKEDNLDMVFKEYLHMLVRTGIWFDDLTSILNLTELFRLSELAVNFLSSEGDLVKTGSEFQKDWFDTESYRHHTLLSEIPNVHFSYESPSYFINSVIHHQSRFEDAFELSGLRFIYKIALKFILENDRFQPLPYQSTLNLLTDLLRPSMVWLTYLEIVQTYSQIIPYLLRNRQLIPLAFQLTDAIKINETFRLSSNGSNDDTRSQLWFNLFDLVIDQRTVTTPPDEGDGGLIGGLLLSLAENLYLRVNKNWVDYSLLKLRYAEALRRVSTQRLNLQTNSSNSVIAFLSECQAYLAKKLTLANPYPTGTKYIQVQLCLLDVSTWTLKWLSRTALELVAEEKESVRQTAKTFTTVLSDAIIEFYTIAEIETQVYYSGDSQQKKVQRGFTVFGFELIDWGYLYLAVEKESGLRAIYNAFIKSISFNISGGLYDTKNQEQIDNIALFLKSLLLAYGSIQQHKEEYTIEDLPVESILLMLEDWIEYFSLTYHVDNLPAQKVDIFQDQYGTFQNNWFHQSLSTLLFKSLNFFPSDRQKKFVTEFFKNSMDLNRMLMAVNLIDDNETIALVAARINQVPIEDFITKSFTITDQQNALVEAVNSANHWHLAKPLIERLKSHYTRQRQQTYGLLLFEIDLLLAFKENDISKLKEIEFPRTSTYSTYNPEPKQIKSFYLALFELFNNENLAEAIRELKNLSAQNPQNIRYAFYLYRAETLAAMNDKAMLYQANDRWQQFNDRLSDKNGLNAYSEAIYKNQLHYYAVIDEPIKFDQTYNQLSKQDLYSDELIPIIYNYYKQRELHELAYEYIIKVQSYRLSHGQIISGSVQSIIANSQSWQLLTRLQANLESLRNLSPQNIPRIIPEIINGQRELREFILNEFILASRVLLDKIHSIKQITHENRFNDLFVAILRLRFPIWGWEIADQSRLGGTASNKDAGEIDLSIQAGGKNIAIFEALILKSGNFTNTKKHILKCFHYAPSLNQYYIIIYYKGPSTNFDSTWATYQADVLKIAYPLGVEVNKVKGFVAIDKSFNDTRNLKVAKTYHGDSVIFFHLMIDLNT